MENKEKIVFEYTKHKELWKYMAQEKTIKRIVERAKEEGTNGAESISYIKGQFIKAKYNRKVICNCFACETTNKIGCCTCCDCPIYIGNCTDSYGTGFYVEYENYIDLCLEAVENEDEEDKNTYLGYAKECALKIANAKLNKESIEYYNIEVV